MIKRFGVEDGLYEDDEGGDYVHYEDYSALRARCADVEGMALVIQCGSGKVLLPIDSANSIARAVSAWLLGK